MPQHFSHLKEVIHGAGSVVKESFRTLLRDPHIMFYPYMAVLLILITSPFVTSFVLSQWHKVEAPTVLTDVNHAAPHTWLTHLGLVSFSFYYTIFVTAFFICAVSSATIASLQEHKKIGWFHGLRVIRHDFWRIAKFAAVSIFFFPLGLYAQRHKFRSASGAFEAITSSFTLSMAQLAPAIVKGHDGIGRTIRHSVDTLGHFWQESLVIRGGTLLGMISFAAAGFLPKLIQHMVTDDDTARILTWIVAGLLGVSSYVILRVTSTVFMTNLYLRAERERRKN